MLLLALAWLLPQLLILLRWLDFALDLPGLVLAPPVPVLLPGLGVPYG